jgi:hypothetical protein
VTSDSERDRSIDRMIRRTLRASAPAEAGRTCIDPETLAAWVEGALSRDDVASLEAHAAGCARCQTMLAAMARTAPPPATTERSWRAWLIPVTVPLTAAAAIAVALSAVLTQQQPSSVEEDRPSASLSAARDYELPGSQVGGGALESRAGRAGEASRLADQDAQMNARAPAPPAPRSTSPAPAAPPSASEDAFASRRAETIAVTEARFVPIEIPSPDPMRRWRLVPGRVERSTDGGVTWIAQYSDPLIAPLAGASPSPDVAWVVGRAGLVLLSTDGRSWRRVAFPETVDLTAIQSTNASTATVVSADGKSFITKNAGSTWDPAPLQEFAAAPF